MAAKVTSGTKMKEKPEGENKQGVLLPPPTWKFTQKSVDGKSTIKESVSKDIQDAAEYWFGKKVEEGRAKDNVKKAGEKLLKLMEFEKKTSVLVFNSDLNHKVRINIIEGAEKLRVEKKVTD